MFILQQNFMQKIRYSNFKGTKKINLYVAIVVVTI